MGPIFQQTEGIILKAIPFKEEDAILSLFTQDAGVIKLFYRGARSRRKGILCMPFTQVEVTYKEKASELFSCQEMKMIDSFFELRERFLYLEVASDLLQVILSSQLLGKPAPHLYALFCYYLRKIPHISNPWILSASFRLKVIKHEGLGLFPLVCEACQVTLEEEGYQYGGAWRCKTHGIPGSMIWEKEEIHLLDRWMNCQSYRDLCVDEMPVDLREKIVLFFEGALGLLRT